MLTSTPVGKNTFHRESVTASTIAQTDLTKRDVRDSVAVILRSGVKHSNYKVQYE